jgi:hypothetical protein
MTTIDPADPGGRRHRTAMWLGHHAPRINIAAFTTMAVGFSLAVIFRDGPMPAWIFVAIGAAAMAFGSVADMCDSAVHRRNLCLLDLDQAPLLDPDAEVTRHADTLRTFHSFKRRLTAVAVGFAFMVAGLIVGGWARDHGVPFAAAIIIVPYSTLMWIQIKNVRMNDVHRRLQRWCPMCGWGRGPDDGDDPEPEPEPTSPPAGRRKVKA